MKRPLVEIGMTPWKYTEAGFKFNKRGNGKFFNMDSNEHIQRFYSPVSETRNKGRNIYPSVYGWAMALEQHQYVLGMVNDRPAGCGYIDFDIQCFLTRNTAADDDKGVPDRLEDTRRTHYSFYLLYETYNSYLEEFVTYSDVFNNPMTLLDPHYTNHQRQTLSLQKHNTKILSENLPKGIELIDLMHDKDNNYFMRVRNNYPQPVNVNLNSLLEFGLTKKTLLGHDTVQKERLPV